MAVKLETLELEIVQSIKSSRSKALDSLEKRLRGLRDALNGFQDADEAVHIIQRISNVTHTLGTAVDSTSKMASALRRLNNATTDMSTAGQNVRNISAAFRDLSNASNFIDGESLQRIVDATGQMSASGRNLGAFSRGLNSVGKDADAIGQTVERFQTFVNTLSEAGDAIDPEPLEKIAGASQAIGTAGNSLNRFARGINALGTSMLEVEVTANRFEKFIYGINDASKAVDTAALAPITEFAKTVGSVGSRLEKFVAALEKLSKFGANSEQLKQALQGIDAIVGRLAQHKAELDALAETLNNVSASLKTLNRAGDVGAQIQRVQKSLKTSGADAAAFARHLVKMPWEHLKNKINGLIKPIQNLGHSFARIAMYRALRTAIKAITTGFSEGIKHLYEWSRAVDTTFKNSMDSLSTSAHYLRDSLGAMASPLIDALAPAIEFLVDKFVSLLNVVNQFISTLTGKDTWRKAVRTPTKYSTGLEDAADSANKATKAQKKLNKALQDFDELNLITTSTTKGRNPSSKSGKGAEDYSTHFEKAPVADWIKEIKNAIKKGDWNGAGKLLATKLNGMLDKWKAKEFGEKIGQKFQNGIDFYLGFMKNFDWAKLGIKAGDFINGILSKVKPKALGEAMVAKLKAALKFLANFSWTVNLKPLGEAFGHAFNELFSADTMNDLGHTISGLINDAIDVGIGFVTTADFGTAAESVMDSLFTAISEINWKDAAKVVAKLATGLLDAIKSALEYAVTHIDVVLQAVWDFVGTLLGELWEYLIGSIGGLLKEFWQYVKENFWESGKDDGNGRKDGPVNSSTTGLGAGTEPTTSSYTQKVNVLYESNAKKIKDEITMFNKMNAKPKITMTTKNFTATSDSIKKMSKGRTVLIYAKKDKDSFNAVTKALNKITIDRTATIKFKPVIETSSGNNLQKTVASAKQLSKLLDIAQGANGLEGINQGTLFLAGEVPGQAEMVGNINGKTGVASGKEITGIADAVRDTGQTEAELLREQNNLLRRLLTKTGTVTLAPSAAAGRWVNQSQAAYARATGG